MDHYNVIYSTLLISVKPMQKRFWYLQWGASIYLVRSCTIAHLPFLRTPVFGSQDEAIAYRACLSSYALQSRNVRAEALLD